MQPLNFQTIGRYHLLEQLGEGGMETVYKAFDNPFDRVVVLRIIRSSLKDIPHGIQGLSK